MLYKDGTFRISAVLGCLAALIMRKLESDTGWCLTCYPLSFDDTYVGAFLVIR